MHYLLISARCFFLSAIGIAGIYNDDCNAQLVLPAGDQELRFEWFTDSVNSTLEPHAALLIPVKLRGCPRQFYMQFDLGAPSSMFYRNKLADIQLRYPGVTTVKDSATQLVNYTFNAGSTALMAREIAIKQFNSSGIDWERKNSVEIIGTIGQDLIAGKVLIINYPEKRLFIGDNIPEQVNTRLTLSNLVLSGSTVLLPAKIKDKSLLLYFDTGSSAFELITDKETCLALAATNAIPVQFRVRSWDKFLTANTISTNDSVEIGNLKIPIRRATYMEGASSAQIEQMMKMGIGGMTGNKLFLNSILVIDTKQKKFGLLNGR